MMMTENQFVDKEGIFHVSDDTTPDFLCNCDCECSKENDREHEQCDDCDNGIHWDGLRKRYVNYEEEESLR